MKWFLSVLLICVGCNTTVEPGTVGVATDWGQTQSWTYPEGFHWVGFGTDVINMSTQLQAYSMGGDEEDREIQARTRDNLNVVVEVTVQFSLHPHTAFTVFQKLGTGYIGTVVRPASRSAVRDAVAQFRAMDAVANRERLGNRMKSLIRASVAETLRNNDVPTHAIQIENVLLRNVALPQSLSESIARVQQERNLTAERQMAIETARQEALRARIEAEGEATVAIVQAERDADTRRIRAAADAQANLTLSRSITPQILEMRRIDAQRAILSSNNTRTIIMGGGNSPTLLNLGAVAR